MNDAFLVDVSIIIMNYLISIILIFNKRHSELQLNKANYSDTETPFLDLNLSKTNGIVSSKAYDKPDDFNFEKVVSIS